MSFTYTLPISQGYINDEYSNQHVQLSCKYSKEFESRTALIALIPQANREKKQEKEIRI